MAPNSIFLGEQYIPPASQTQMYIPFPEFQLGFTGNSSSSSSNQDEESLEESIESGTNQDNQNNQG